MKNRSILDFKITNYIGRKILNRIQKYDHVKYWKRRNKVVDKNYKKIILYVLYQKNRFLPSLFIWN